MYGSSIGSAMKLVKLNLRAPIPQGPPTVQKLVKLKRAPIPQGPPTFQKLVKLKLKSQSHRDLQLSKNNFFTESIINNLGKSIIVVTANNINARNLSNVVCSKYDC